MLDLQMNLMQQISGLSGAIQGQRAASGTPSSLYSQQAANSQLNYRPLFETIRHFTASRDEKLLKVLMQYYSEPRHISLSGASVGKAEQFYLPQMADKVVDFNLVVSQCTDTPVYRQAFDDVMMSMVDKGYISFKQYLNNCSLPFAERLLSQMEQNQSEALTEAENPAINNLNEELKKAYSLFRGN